MDKLEQLLSNPDSHGETPSDEQVRAWGKKALERWAIENQDVRSTAPQSNRFAERLHEAIYWAGAAACLAYLVSLLYSYTSSAAADFSMVEWNLPSANDFSLVLRANSVLISAVSCAIGLAVTRPVREFWLRQLG